MESKLAWGTACLLVAAESDECHAPAENKYSMVPPAATYPARPRRELSMPFVAIIRWRDGDESRLAASLGTLRATLPRARITIAARDVERARRVGARAGQPHAGSRPVGAGPEGPRARLGTSLRRHGQRDDAPLGRATQ